jgi:RNA ligase
MIAPFISDGNLYWGTKMGKTDLSQQPEQFVSDKPHYVDFVTTMIKNGKTPIFEWCSRKQRIVLDYPVDKLYLVGIRDMETGNYSSYDELKQLACKYSIDLVGYYADRITDINIFINHTKDLVDEEGYVVVFENGNMLKIKADDYVKIHKCLDGFRYEKDIIKIIVNDDLDDVLPYLRDDLKNDVVLYSDRILHNISHLSVEIFNYITVLFEKYGDSKENRRYVAENAQRDYPKDSGIVFSCYKGDVSLNDVREQIVSKIDKNTSSISKVENIRHIIKENWNNYGLSGLSFDN